MLQYSHVYIRYTFKYGRMSKGDSLIPRKMLAGATTLSHMVVPKIDCSIQPSLMMTHCIAPK